MRRLEGKRAVILGAASVDNMAQITARRFAAHTGAMDFMRTASTVPWLCVAGLV